MKLLELQRRMAADVMRPLTGSDHIAPKTSAAYVKPNDRLSSLERLEIYNRQYWFRVIDSMYEDFAGLRAVLGQRSFDRLVRAYVSECPSQTFTLRNLRKPFSDELPRYWSQMKLNAARLHWPRYFVWRSRAQKK